MEQLNQQEFKILLLLHAAHCDYSFHPNEKAFLRLISTKETLDKVQSLFDQRKTESFSFIIKYFKQYFPEKDDREKLKSELLTLFEADDKFCDFEKGFIKYFNHLADLDTIPPQ